MIVLENRPILEQLSVLVAATANSIESRLPTICASREKSAVSLQGTIISDVRGLCSGVPRTAGVCGALLVDPPRSAFAGVQGVQCSTV